MGHSGFLKVNMWEIVLQSMMRKQILLVQHGMLIPYVLILQPIGRVVKIDL